MNENERFATLAGVHWHDHDNDPKSETWALCVGCGKPYYEAQNPDFTDAREVWKVLKDKGLSDEFTVEHGAVGKNGSCDDMLPIEFFTIPGKLRDAAIEWMEGRK